MVKGEVHMTADMSNRIALVTGASRGIGYAVAKSFAEAGATVIAVGRTQGALEDLDEEVQALGHPPLVLVPMNLMENTKIDQMAALIAERYGRLDVLVGCAGMLGELRPIAHYEPDMFGKVLSLNLTANWRLIRAFDGLLRLSDAGRAMFVTSGVTQGSPAYWGAYSISKSGLEAMVRTYAAELGETRVKANLIDPGVVRTRMRSEAFPGEDPMSLPEPSTITSTFHELASPTCSINGEVVFAQS